ncbi:inositol monophosphatase family protein, partial [Limnohabitans sp.]|uniref:inositol monophosphatase family protein n=1 Tax=Limnohabitans sp. TaxID=1907725 RepID=UPI0037BFE28D
MNTLAAQARDFAQTLALEAAHMVRQATGQQHAVEFKSAGDWCSALDRRIEDHLRARIAATFPAHGFLGEESAQA